MPRFDDFTSAAHAITASAKLAAIDDAMRQLKYPHPVEDNTDEHRRHYYGNTSWAGDGKRTVFVYTTTDKVRILTPQDPFDFFSGKVKPDTVVSFDEFLRDTSGYCLPRPAPPPKRHGWALGFFRDP